MEYFHFEFIHKDDSSKYYRTTCKWLYTIIINTILNKYNILVINLMTASVLKALRNLKLEMRIFFYPLEDGDLCLKVIITKEDRLLLNIQIEGNNNTY